MAKQQLKYVGRSVPRVDGVEKVTGAAKFLGDLVVPGMLHGKILRSAYPHARILSIDTSKAESLPGVAAVLTAADIGDLIPTYNGRPVIAQWNEEGVTICSSAQHPFQVRGDIAKIFRMPISRVRMIISYLGGGYGSKSYTKFEPLVVALARKAGAPVRVCNSVSDSMLT